MSHFNTVYNQILHLIPGDQFDKIVKKYNGDYYVKYFSCWQQFLTLLYAQIKSKDSLRDIEISLRAHSKKWYHIGLRDIKRSTLSDANKLRDYRIYQELFYCLLQKCRSVRPKHRFRFKNPLCTLDATVIDLCLSLFPWARFKKTKGALKIHYLYDHSGAIPLFLVVTEGKQHELKVAKSMVLPIVPGTIVSEDRAYIISGCIHLINQGLSLSQGQKKHELQDRTEARSR